MSQARRKEIIAAILDALEGIAGTTVAKELQSGVSEQKLPLLVVLDNGERNNPPENARKSRRLSRMEMSVAVVGSISQKDLTDIQRRAALDELYDQVADAICESDELAGLLIDDGIAGWTYDPNFPAANKNAASFVLLIDLLYYRRPAANQKL